MIRTLLAALVAVGLMVARPATACEDCKNCPHHKVAEADKKPEPKGCACTGDHKECKCGKDCKCPHCHHGDDKKDEKKS